jgi:hypothetical protein
VDLIGAHIAERGLSRDDLLFSSSLRPSQTPVSRNTFRTRVWLPALEPRRPRPQRPRARSAPCACVVAASRRCRPPYGHGPDRALAGDYHPALPAYVARRG